MIFETVARLFGRNENVDTERNRQRDEARKLAESLRLSKSGEVVPLFDVENIYDNKFSDPYSMSYHRYEAWCRIAGIEPNPARWARSHGVYNAFDNEPDGAA